MKKIKLLVAAMLCFATGATAQELTEQLYNMYGEHSIIREVDSARWMLYSDIDELSFSLVADGNATIDFIKLPSEFTSVSDFVISGNAVWFCGMRGGVPVMGYFSTLSFPATIVHYCELTVDTLTAIEVMNISLDKHVVMIGQQNDMGILIDALQTPSGCNTYYILLLTNNSNYTIHNDLAITDSHVVVTSYNYINEPDMDTTMPYSQGYIWFVEKPLSSGSSLAASTPYYMHVPTMKNNSPFIVTACEGDACVAATAAFISEGIWLNPGINVYGFVGKNNIQAVRLVNNTSCDILNDICYDRGSRTTELLVHKNLEDHFESYIYTLGQTTQPGTVNGRHYQGQFLNSLIDQSHNVNRFIASGTDNNDHSNLYLYRYNNTDWESCTERIVCTESKLDRGKTKNGKQSYYWIFHEEATVEPVEKGTVKKNVCPQK